MANLLENGISDKTDSKVTKLEENSHGGSQQSLNSTTSSVPSASDNPEQIIVQKQRKELVEEGIKR